MNIIHNQDEDDDASFGFLLLLLKTKMRSKRVHVIESPERRLSCMTFSGDDDEQDAQHTQEEA